jgi:membrane fusion protein, multidrug efflux system
LIYREGVRHALRHQALLSVAALMLAMAPVAAKDATRGLVRAVQEATLASELAARIVKLPFRDGDAFKRGDILLDFDCDRPKAEWKVAEAERLGAVANHDNARRLMEYRAAGAHDVQIARAALEKAAAAVEVIEVRLRQCRIFAPFDGRMVEVPVREHEMPQAGQPLMRIVSDQHLEIGMIVPARWLAWLKPGERFVFAPEESPLRFDGEVLRIAGAVDPVSQTIRAVGRILRRDGPLLPGQGGAIHFQRSGS